MSLEAMTAEVQRARDLALADGLADDPAEPGECRELALLILATGEW